MKNEIECYTFHQIIFFVKVFENKKVVNPDEHWMHTNSGCTPNVTLM